MSKTIEQFKFKGFHVFVVQVNEKDSRTEVKYIVGSGNPFWVNFSDLEMI